MFGLLGKQQAHIIVDSPGHAAGGLRHFRIGIGSTDHKATGFLLFDIEAASATKPSLIFRVPGGSESYGKEASANITENYSLVDFASGLFTTLLQLAEISLAAYKGWTYASTAALSPTHRKYKIVLSNPNAVEVLRLSPQVNNAALVTGSNNASGTLTIDGNAMHNLKHLIIDEVFLTTLNLRVDSITRLQTFALWEAQSSLTINGSLPKSIKNILLGNLTGVTSVNTLLENCVNCESLLGGVYAPAPALTNPLTTLTGTLDIDHMTAIKELALLNLTSLTAFSLPTVASNQWRIFQIDNCDTAFNAINATYLNDVLTSSALVFFSMHSNNRVWAKSFTNSDVPTSLLGMYLYGNQITGDFTVTAARTALKDLRLGISAAEANRFDNIDLTGLDGGALTNLQINGVLCEDLSLPATLPSINIIEAYDNELDISTNSDLVTKLNGYTSLTQLWLSQDYNANLVGGFTGQNSTNGLGANPDFSSLVNLTRLVAGDCKITGTLTLANVNKLVLLNIGFNSGITSIANLAAHTGIQILRANSCTSLSISIGTTFTALNDVRLANTLLTTCDLSGKTTTAQIVAVILDGSTVTALTMPSSSSRAAFGNSHQFSAVGCTSLTAINNLEYVNMRVNAAVNYNFLFSGCTSLNITLPFGTSDFCPTTIDLSNNSSLSQANLDATILNIHSNRSKWDFFSHGTRILNIGGTTVAASGTYQAPAVAGSPASAKEALHELVNVKGWTITYN